MGAIRQEATEGDYMMIEMTDFSVFKEAVRMQFEKMLKMGGIFRVAVERDLLWGTYIKSFEDGTDPIYRERTEHDCSCCRHFIKDAGGMVAVHKNKLVSIWDVKVEGRYQPVADALSALAKSKMIENVFLHANPMIGVNKNLEQTDDGVLTWEHFYLELPHALQVPRGVSIGTKLGGFRSTFDVMLRSLNEITVDALDTVLDLIGQKSLYRGEEHTTTVTNFRKLKVEFDKAKNKEFFCWLHVQKDSPAMLRIRSTSIGTLLVDLSGGRDLESAVGAFESIVAPQNYKRPTSLITKGMIAKAKEAVAELGLTDSLSRRFAVLEDIEVSNVLFADRSAKRRMHADVFDDLEAETPGTTRKLDKVEEISIETFVDEVLPKVDQIELLVENEHTAHFVSLIAPSDAEAKLMFKWDNPFSWSYAGEVADSIKERVKAAGGDVTGDLRCSLSWYNSDDLDLHMREAGGDHIFFGTKHSRQTNGQLDVDMNAGGLNNAVDPVENITYPSRSRMSDGIYQLMVNQYMKRNSERGGFEVEIEFDGVIHHFSYPRVLKSDENVRVADIELKSGVFRIAKAYVDCSQSPKTVWGINTQTFHRVETVMFSPNHWNGKPVGNRHYMFFLDGCKSDEKARGFFNEFLMSDLDPHRKVLEIVGSRTSVAESDNQLSGLGFSSTQRNSIVARVRGSFNRDLKITF